MTSVVSERGVHAPSVLGETAMVRMSENTSPSACD